MTASIVKSNLSRFPVQYHDARCGEWAQSFFPLVVSAQGVTVGYKDLTVNFHGAVPAQPANTVAGFYIPARAQGGQVPTEQWFGAHVIDEYQAPDGTWLLLDPSYGVRVSGATAQAAEQAWATHVIAAGVQGDWVASGGFVAGLGFTGYVQGSAPFAMQPGDFSFPSQTSPGDGY